MEYLLLYATGTDPQPYDPAADNIAEWVADLIARDASEFGERLRPGEDATTVRVRDGRTLVTEGPFTEAKEWVGGFDIIDCADLDEAIDIASKHPAARTGTVEVRPFVGSDNGTRVVPDGIYDRPSAGQRYLMLVCADRPAPEGVECDDPQAWVDEMDGRGVRLFGQVLQPPADATSVRTRRGQVLVTDGPFAEGKEWIAGIDVLETADLAAAVQVAAAHPMASTGLMVLTPVWPLDPNDDHVEREQREAPERGVRREPHAEVLL
jgi:hypothetical protein